MGQVISFNGRSETETPEVYKMIQESSYYSLFAPGGEYNTEFEQLLDTTKGETDLLWLIIKFTSFGVICGKRQERKRRNRHAALNAEQPQSAASSV